MSFATSLYGVNSYRSTSKKQLLFTELSPMDNA